jgi:MFS-type transporter involved in bile tolerance (Atg22 family)
MRSAENDAQSVPLLERLGLHRPALRAWAMYEWAITGMWAVVVATVFPIYFQAVLSGDLPKEIATRNFAYATTTVITMTGSSRLGILSVILFFIVGGAILYFVDETEGRRIAAAVQAQALPDPEAEPVF